MLFESVPFELGQSPANIFGNRRVSRGGIFRGHAKRKRYSKVKNKGEFGGVEGGGVVPPSRRD